MRPDGLYHCSAGIAGRDNHRCGAGEKQEATVWNDHLPAIFLRTAVDQNAAAGKGRGSLSSSAVLRSGSTAAGTPDWRF